MTLIYRPLLLPFDGVEPAFATPLIFCGAGAGILGKATIGARASIGAGALIRADGHFVRAGDDFSLGEAASVHIAHDIYPAVIGDDVAVGRNAVVHACTIGDRCVIEDDSVVLDGAIVEDDVLIEAGSTIFPRAKLAQGFVYGGSPAKQLRALTPGEREARGRLLRDAVATAPPRENGVGAGAELAETAFVALTARLRGRVICADGSSVFFSCGLDARQGVISIGARTNVQDNSLLRGNVVIGADTTIGHNVRMSDCQIGAHVLIGIGSVLAEGTKVGGDVLLAGGSTTTPGQQIEAGQLWAGRPARRIGRLDDGKRAMMKLIVEQYCVYAADYRKAQDSVSVQ